VSAIASGLGAIANGLSGSFAAAGHQSALILLVVATCAGCAGCCCGFAWGVIVAHVVPPGSVRAACSLVGAAVRLVAEGDRAAAQAARPLRPAALAAAEGAAETRLLTLASACSNSTSSYSGFASHLAHTP